MRMQLEDLVNDSSIFPRGSVSDIQVNRLIQAMDAGVKVPPITVEKSTKRIVDGWHRTEASRRQGLKTIEAIAKSYASEADLFADAVRLNIDHGLPLTSYHVRAAIVKLEQYGFERVKIGEVVRMTVEQIEKIERGFASDEQGEPVALKSGLSNMRGATLSEAQLAVNRKYSGPKAVFFIRQLKGVIENDMWPTDHPTFAAEMDELCALWQRKKV